jgi:DNA-binding CsgD family transcriptional regulator
MNAAERDFWRLFFLESKTGIWMATLKRPMPVNLPLNQQYVHISRHAFLSQCNKSFAGMSGCRSPLDLIGSPLSQLFFHPSSSGPDILRQFLLGGCKVLQGAISNEISRNGDSLYFDNLCIGLLHKQRLIRIWGIRQILSEERRKILQRRTLLDQLTGSQRLILEMTVHGKSLKEIGAALSLSINTVESYRLRALRKLELKSVPQLIRHAAPLGLDNDPDVKESGRITSHPAILSR